MPIYGIWKDGTDEPFCRAVMETQKGKTYLWAWTGGVGGMDGESSV